MRRFLLVFVTSAAAVAAPGDPVQVQPATARMIQPTIHRGERLVVEVRLFNTTDAPITYRIMNCSWQDQWRTDDPTLVVAGAECDKNSETTLQLTPGAGDLRTLQLEVTSKAALGDHALRLGFTAIGARATQWTPKVNVRVVDVGAGLAIANHVARQTVDFELTNTTKQPIEIGSQLELQALAQGAWEDLSVMPAGDCFATAACVTVPSGGHVKPRAWPGTVCAQCNCDRNGAAQPGTYRLIAHACHGATDHVGPAFQLPPN